MTREGAPSKQSTTSAEAGRPIWVWLIYVLGFIAGVILALRVLFTIGASFLSDDETEVSYDASWLATVLWGALVALALGTWYARRRR